MGRPTIFLFALQVFLQYHASFSTMSTDLQANLTPAWKSACDVQYDVDSDVNATLNCHVTGQDRDLLRLADLREALGSLVNSTRLTVAVNLSCSTGGMVSLPWPARAPGMVKLSVVNCGLLDKYADFNTSAERIPDSLRVLDMRDCAWLNKAEAVDRVIQHAELVTSDYECGQDSTLQIHRYRNVSDADLDMVCVSLYHDAVVREEGRLSGSFPSDFANILSWNDSAVDELLRASRGLGAEFSVCADRVVELRRRNEDGMGPRMSVDLLEDVRYSRVQLRKISVECVYQHLEVMDESQAPILDRNHFQYMVEDTQYPMLRTLNYSYTGIDEVPKEIREWRIYFHGSNLTLVDLSHNKVKEVGPILPYSNPLGDLVTTIDLRFNDIRCISKAMFRDWALVPGLYVDVRHNPIDCCCKESGLAELITSMRNSSQWSGHQMSIYLKDLSTMKCAYPQRLAGRLLSSLDAVEDLQCKEMRPEGDSGEQGRDEDVRSSLVAAVAVLAVLVVVLLLLLLAMAVRFRDRLCVCARPGASNRLILFSAAGSKGEGKESTLNGPF